MVISYELFLKINNNYCTHIFQTLMNVLKSVMNVMNTVTTPLAVILAIALDLVIDSTVMAPPVKVCNYHHYIS